MISQFKVPQQEHNDQKNDTFYEGGIEKR